MFTKFGATSVYHLYTISHHCLGESQTYPAARSFLSLRVPESSRIRFAVTRRDCSHWSFPIHGLVIVECVPLDSLTHGHFIARGPIDWEIRDPTQTALCKIGRLIQLYDLSFLPWSHQLPTHPVISVAIPVLWTSLLAGLIAREH